MFGRRSKKKKVLQTGASAPPSIPPPPGPNASARQIDQYFSKYQWVQDEKTDRNPRLEIKPSRSQLNLALPAEQLKMFTQYAKKKHIPPSTLARMWLLERLEHETKETQT